MKYDISNKVQKTSAKGTQYVSATLTDEEKKEYVGINAFHGEFSADTWYGELEKSPDGKFWNLVTPKKAANSAFTTMQVEKKQEVIEKSVAKAQDNKEHGIKVSSSMNKAIDLAIAEFANPKSLDTLEELISKWRRWIWTHWDQTDEYPPFGN